MIRSLDLSHGSDDVRANASRLSTTDDMRLLTALAALFFGLCCTGCTSWFDNSSSLYRAEELTQREQYDEAITAYREHIDDRLHVSNRPEWENPHFYLLRIGDIKLRQGDPKAALDSYQEAEREKVEPSLISDRYRAVASWYVEKGRLQEAFELLKTYRDRDSLLFDAMLDRIGRELTKQEARPAQ